VELPTPHVKAAIIVFAAPPSLICTIVVPVAFPIITPEHISVQPAFLFKMVAPSFLELKDRVSSADCPVSVSMYDLFTWDPGGRAAIVQDGSPAIGSALERSWMLGISISQDVKGLFSSHCLA
jgi:hypothetical protein